MTRNLTKEQLDGLSRAMQNAVARGDCDALEGCIRLGGDIDRLIRIEPNYYPRPIMHWVARNFDEKIAMIVLQSTANIDVIDEKGNTALMEAVLMRNEDAIAFLAKWGADPLAQNKANETAIDVLREKIKESGWDVQKNYMAAILPKDVRTPPKKEVKEQADIGTGNDVTPITIAFKNKKESKQGPGTGGLKL